jgi:hypothetical protein
MLVQNSISLIYWIGNHHQMNTLNVCSENKALLPKYTAISTKCNKKHMK